ncbi:hypothetical protein [Haloarcula marina]|uniref:hypothetical protein n=1 Tax=Haloarcula marina TaxID=2961574 RepID=UPI0020B878DB|nr:hypothetical protein [Halomicroarcula marina]
MKSGTGDDPFADDSEDTAADNNARSSDGASEALQTPTESASEERRRPDTQISELPYKYRRDSVKEARTQQPMFLQDSTEDLIEETLDEMEAEFDESVYKTDVVEAMLVAGAEGASPAAVLRRWGYGMKNR